MGHILSFSNRHPISSITLRISFRNMNIENKVDVKIENSHFILHERFLLREFMLLLDLTFFHHVVF